MQADAAAYCAERVRRHDRERWLAALFAPEAARRTLHALYAFNLEVASLREVVREPHMGLIRLQWWRDALEGMRAGAPRAHPVCAALAPAIATLPAEPFERLLTARERDLDDAPFADLAALEAYAEATSATLVALTLAALGVDDPASREAGRGVGTAWALTGLLRAAPLHAAQGRPRLPEGSAPAVAARARTLFAAARAGGADRRAFPALAVARLADVHLARLARAGDDPTKADMLRPQPLAPLRLAIARLRRRW